MIEKLPRENYRSVASLFAPLDRHPIVQGVLDERTRSAGGVYTVTIAYRLGPAAFD